MKYSFIIVLVLLSAISVFGQTKVCTEYGDDTLNTRITNFPPVITVQLATDPSKMICANTTPPNPPGPESGLITKRRYQEQIKNFVKTEFLITKGSTKWHTDCISFCGDFVAFVNKASGKRVWVCAPDIIEEVEVKLPAEAIGK